MKNNDITYYGVINYKIIIRYNFIVLLYTL